VTLRPVIPSFGRAPAGVPVVRRPSAYAVVSDGHGRIAVVRTPGSGRFLPGGGIEAGESAGQTIVREAREECGLELRPGGSLGFAEEIVHAPGEGAWFAKQGAFLAAEPRRAAAPPGEPGHALEWRTPAEAVALLAPASHRWIVQRWSAAGAATAAPFLFRRAGADDLERCLTLARAAQERLAARGLGQYVPAAHAPGRQAVEARLAAGSLFAVVAAGPPGAFFVLDPAPSPWWPPDGVRALHLSGMVVDAAWRGRGTGSSILAWCAAEASRRGFDAVRLDCHAGNPWLGGYYAAHGFVLRGRVAQQPGYEGSLYERRLAGADGIEPVVPSPGGQG
jgi:8-oxo-dGTP diphosphatase